MPRPLPASPSLEQLRNQAKDLLKACRAGDPLAAARFRAHVAPGARLSASLPHPPRFLLSDALQVIAREHGFASWPKLKAHVVAAASRLQPGAALGPASAPDRKMTPRRRYVQELAEQVLDLARRHEIELLVRRLCLPLRDILAVRAWIWETGSHPLLVDALLSGLEHPNARIRHDCAHAMDHLADERCAAPLRRLLNDPVPRVRRAALHSLSCDACKLVPLSTNDDFVVLIIERALNDSSIQVRRHAVYGLGGSCYDARAVAALETLLARETDPALLRGARWALGRQETFRAGA